MAKESRKKPIRKKLTWATVNLENPEERARFFEQEDRKAQARVVRAIKTLKTLGIIDADGKCVKPELLRDIQEESTLTFLE